jgi:hypothetical protein
MLYINQLQPSTLRWDALGLSVTLRSSTFSDDGFATMSLLFSVGGAAESFASGAKSVTVNIKVWSVQPLHQTCSEPGCQLPPQRYGCFQDVLSIFQQCVAGPSAGVDRCEWHADVA